jgi:dTDP-glucose 4,6-dehydratase
MRVLVTGGAGFIGSAVCRHLVRQHGHHVVNVDKLTYAANRDSLKAVRNNSHYLLIKADIADRAAMDAIFEQHRPDAVMHLAAETHVDRSITGSAAFVSTNIVGTYNLLEASRRYCEVRPSAFADRFRFIHVSTDEVYGSLGSTGRFAENFPYNPSSPYSASKAASDHLALAWHRTYGLPVIVSNCSNNYGPYQFPEKLLPLIIINAFEGKTLPIYGDGSNVRDWLHVEDHASGLITLLAAGRPGEKYNFGGNSERTNLQVVTQVCDVIDAMMPGGSTKRSLIRYVPDRPGHDHRYAIDASKARRELAWKPEVTFEAGIASTVEWYLENRPWWEPLRQSVYDGSRLGLIEKRAREAVESGLEHLSQQGS